MTRDELNAKLKEDLTAQFGDQIISLEMSYDLLALTVPVELHHQVAEWAKNDDFWEFNHFIDITAVDQYNRFDTHRFEIVVHLRSHKHNLKFRYKSMVPKSDNPTAPTLTDVYVGASWTEREIYDLMGITFTGHPRMTRILSPDDFVGHPLQKDFPVKGHHRGEFPKGTVVSNKRREVAAPVTRHAPVDQALPRTPWEQRREPLREKENDDA